MPIPTRVPTEYAFDTLNRMNRGYARFHPIHMQELEPLEEDHLINVASLRQFFNNRTAYTIFRNSIHVEDRYWIEVIQMSPHMRNYCTKFFRPPSTIPPRRNIMRIIRDYGPGTMPRTQNATPGTATRRSRSRSPIPCTFTHRSRSRSPSPPHRVSRNPTRRVSRSPTHRGSRSPTHRGSRNPSPQPQLSESPTHRGSRSPTRRRSPLRRVSRSPTRRRRVIASRSRSPTHRRRAIASRSRSPTHRRRATARRSRSPISRNASRSRSASPLQPAAGKPKYKRGELKMHSKLGRLSHREIRNADKSTIEILPCRDECDDTDVNLPKSTCKAVRKVCRRYNSARRYMPYVSDGTENKEYDIKVFYTEPPSRGVRGL